MNLKRSLLFAAFKRYSKYQSYHQHSINRLEIYVALLLVFVFLSSEAIQALSLIAAGVSFV
jgi:hypothetical protein